MPEEEDVILSLVISLSVGGGQAGSLWPYPHEKGEKTNRQYKKGIQLVAIMFGFGGGLVSGWSQIQFHTRAYLQEGQEKKQKPQGDEEKREWPN